MIPALNTKTNMLLVDDDSYLLRDLCDFLPKSHSFKTFTNPIAGLNYVKTLPQAKAGEKEFLFNDFKSAKFESMTSVIVVDYSMEPINGLEFCEKLDNTTAKRIMLTSHATKDLAIQAFNNKLIDVFLLKTESDMLDNLAKAINKCTIDFFKDISVGIEGFNSKHNPLSCSHFSQFFLDFCISNKIQSHCCFHDFYNILLKDIHGKEIFMAIYDNEHLEDLLCSEQAESAELHVIDQIKNRQAAPCFKDTGRALIPDGAAWGKLMVPLTSVSQDLAVAIG